MIEKDRSAPMPAPMGSSATAGPAGNPPEAPNDGAVGGGLDDLGPPLFETVRSKEVTQRWHEIQAAFVDDPRGALRQAGPLNRGGLSPLPLAPAEREQT